MTQPTEYELVTYNAPDGAQFGKSTTDKIAFYGSTPIVKPTIDSAVSTTSTISTSGAWGFASQAEINQIVAAVSTTAYQLKQLGLVA